MTDFYTSPETSVPETAVTARDDPWLRSLPIGPRTPVKLSLKDARNIVFFYRGIKEKFARYIAPLIRAAREMLENQIDPNNNCLLYSFHSGIGHGTNPPFYAAMYTVLSNDWPTFLADFINSLPDEQERFAATRIVGYWEPNVVGLQNFIAFWTEYVTSWPLVEPKPNTTKLVGFRNSEIAFVERLTGLDKRSQLYGPPLKSAAEFLNETIFGTVFGKL